MTTGAIYGSFKSKEEELFLAIFEAPASGVDVQFRNGALSVCNLRAGSRGRRPFEPGWGVRWKHRAN